MLLSEAPLNRTHRGILPAPSAARLSQPGTGRELAEMHQGADLADPRAIGAPAAPTQCSQVINPFPPNFQQPRVKPSDGTGFPLASASGLDQ